MKKHNFEHVYRVEEMRETPVILGYVFDMGDNRAACIEVNRAGDYINGQQFRNVQNVCALAYKWATDGDAFFKNFIKVTRIY